jgi:hypothetical protein
LFREGRFCGNEFKLALYRGFKPLHETQPQMPLPFLLPIKNGLRTALLSCGGFGKGHDEESLENYL